MRNEKGGLPLSNPPPLQTDRVPPQHLRDNLPADEKLSVVSSVSPEALGVWYALPPSIIRSLQATAADACVAVGGGSVASDARRKVIVRALCFQHYFGAQRRAMTALTMSLLGKEAEPWDADALVDQARWRVDGGAKPGWLVLKSKTPAPIGLASKPKLRVEDRVEYLQSIRSLVSTADWPGRTGGRDRSAMQAICDLSLALDYPTITPAVSGGVLAARANCTEKVARAALASLQKSGHLRKVGDGVGPFANTYLVVFPVTLMKGAVLIELLPVQLALHPLRESLRVSHAAFHRNALGRSVFALLEYLLCNAPAENTEWFKASGVSEASFYRLLPKINGEVYGQALAVHQDGVWRLTDNAMSVLDGIAREEGTAVAIEHRAARARLRGVGYLAHLMRQTSEAERYKMRVDGSAIDKLTGEVMSGREAVERSTAADLARSESTSEAPACVA